METKLYIIGDSADKDNILAICSQLSDKGIKADAIFPAEDRAASENASTASFALLWISSKAGSQLFNIAQERNKRNLTTLNFFAEPVALSDSERRTVGRNQSIFAEVNQNEIVDDIVKLIETDSDTNSIARTKVKGVNNSNLNSHVGVEQDERLLNPQGNGMNKEIQDLTEHSEDSEEIETTDANVKVFKPWIVAIVIIIAGYLQTIIEDHCNFHRDEIGGYIILGVGMYIGWTCIKGVKNYKKINGNSLVSLSVLIMAWLYFLINTVLFIINLWILILH